MGGNKGNGVASDDRGNGGTAPSYIDNQFMSIESKPKGKNIEEDNSMTGENKSIGATDIGGKDDPGRKATKDQMLRNESCGLKGMMGKGKRAVVEGIAFGSLEADVKVD
jgi:hypothetical protein